MTINVTNPMEIPLSVLNEERELSRNVTTIVAIARTKTMSPVMM